MPEEIALGFKIILELIKALNPSELEKLKREIRKREEEIEEKMQKIIEAHNDGDIDLINTLLFGK